jgi:hypothetical protein
MVTLAMSERKREIFKKNFFENLSFPFRHSQRYHLRYSKSKPNSKKTAPFATTKGRPGKGPPLPRKPGTAQTLGGRGIGLLLGRSSRNFFKNGDQVRGAIVS